MTKTLRRKKPGRHSKPRHSHPLVVFCAAVVLMAAGSTSAQTQRPSSREIIAEDFTKNRPKTSAPSPGGGTLSNQPSASQPSASDRKNQSTPNIKKRYRLASTTPQVSSSRPIIKSSPTTSRPGTHSNFEQLGITIWRLRPARANDTGARALVMEDGNSSEWVPERIEADTALKFGDRVRLSIESPRTGYLYVVDRDLFADGTMGDAMLIFPTLSTRGGDNQVRAGKLIDIPAQDDRQSYFTAKSVRSDQVGEVLSIIVKTSPLDLPINNKPLKISSSEIAQWEQAWAPPVERFEMRGGAGQTWTKEEKEAGASASSRQLTQEEPPPQTIYRLFAKSNGGLLVSLRLRYRGSSTAN